MSVMHKGLAALGLVMLATPALAADDPLTAPVAAKYAGAFGEPAPPRLLYGNTWALGSPTLSVTVVDSGEGLVLIDAGLAQWAPVLEAHLAQIGHSIREVKLIVSTEPHYDHASGIAALARDSGARVVASEAGAQVLRAGHSGRSDPQFTELFAYPPVPVVEVVRDGETLRVGSLELTAHATPGHTPGSMSWSWKSCAHTGGCQAFVATASLSALTDEVYRYSDPANAQALAAFRGSFTRLRALPCERVIASHPQHAQAAGATGAAVEAPCRALADHFEGELAKVLAREAAG
ncbi:MBL fold metallo-hydrolase [Novosphingobium profundi]|uniref:MBL fold metallo-hydrolase n=1 Tax=Novosphingobium profundi TaxID=1774954 RepID=UPI001BD9E2B9|nr:MBL fold metallo-hydrolase [Novosphingobium profundi]MBT0671165.1 MBL fold metallo-hydrolase [Novosphingobium profundi]